MEHSINEVDRRALLKGAAVGVVAAGSADLVAGAPAEAADKKALQDPKILAVAHSFKSGDATIQGFLARPKAPGKYGTAILTPDIFGLTDYARETAAQVAQAGLACLVVDQYSRAGGAPKTNDFTVLRAFVTQNAPDQQSVNDIAAAIQHLKKQDFTNGKFGIFGFCMGGRVTLLAAAHSPEIVAASPYYGPVRSAGASQLAPMDVAGKIRAAVQGHYGANDMNPKPEDVEAFYAKLRETNKAAEFTIYPGAGHAFHSFGRPSYVPDVAEKAWSATLAFFQKHLR